MTSHAGCFYYYFLIWSCCYALAILVTRYLHRDSFQQSRLFTVVDTSSQYTVSATSEFDQTKTITKLITKKSNNCNYN